MYWPYRHTINIISNIANSIGIIYSGEYTSVINMLLIGFNSSSKVIIIINANRFERVEDGKYTSVIGVLLT